MEGLKEAERARGQGWYRDREGVSELKKVI